MCDSLGIDFSGQLQKLKGRSWATVVQRSTVANDGRTREMVFVDSRPIPMWLANIDEHRVAEEAKPKLIAYQCEAAEALDAYFNQRVSNVPAVNQFDVLRAAIDQIEAAQREASEAKALAQRTEARLDGIEGRHDWLSALAYSKIHGLHTSVAATRQLGISASRIARQRGIEPEKTQHSHYGAVNKYPSWIWDQARPEPPN